MGDVLSQNEIDSLLAALSTGELDVEEIKDNKEETVRKNDFVRVTAEISGKIDDLSSYLRGKI